MGRALMKWLVVVQRGTSCGSDRRGACPPSAIDMDDAAQSRLPGMKEEVRSALGSREDLDTCARVHSAMRQGPTISVEVTLPDGRMAARDVAHREDVVPMLEALLLVPPAPQPSAPSLRRRSRSTRGRWLRRLPRRRRAGASWAHLWRTTIARDSSHER